MIPPFAPYIPLNHPDDLLPIAPTRRAASSPDVWVKWLADDVPPASIARGISLFGKLARRLDALRFRKRRIESDTRC